MNLVKILYEQVKTLSDYPAIIENQHGKAVKITFGEMANRVDLMSSVLHTAGLKKGGIVLIFHPMTIDLYCTILAVFKLGCTVMFIDPSRGVSYIKNCCRIRKPDALVISPKAGILCLFSDTLRRIPLKFSLGGLSPGTRKLNRFKNAVPHKDICECDPDDPALITFTSGSTGNPKGISRSHGFLLAQHKVNESTLKLETGKIDLCTLPVFLLANLASGVASIIPDTDLRHPGAVDSKKVFKQIQTHRPSSTTASPAFMECLAKYAIEKKSSMDSFERIHVGGGPVFPKAVELIRKATPAAEILIVYGSTEAEPIAAIDSAHLTADDMKLMSDGGGLPVGKPIDLINIRIFPDQWGKVIGSLQSGEFESMCLDAGEVGEIVVSGDHVISHYINGTGEEETKFEVDGVRWHRTGDAGYFDQNGNLWLLGRSSAVIRDSDGVIYPFAVEVAACNFENVKRAALVKHDKKRVVVIQPEEFEKPVSIDELKGKLSWARIDEVRIMKNIPVDKRHNAKIDYPELKKRL